MAEVDELHVDHAGDYQSGVTFVKQEELEMFPPLFHTFSKTVRTKIKRMSLFYENKVKIM